MAIVTTNHQHYADIAAAIRTKSGGTDLYLPSEMPGAILNLSTASGNSEIIVYAPTGSVITVTSGDTVKTATEDNGVWRFLECGVGSWTVTASKNGMTSESTVEIMEPGQLLRYEVHMGYGHIYGIVRDITSASPEWTRTNEAVGKTASASVGNVAGHSDFDSIYPWSEIQRETLPTGDVMVKVPKFWYRRYRDGNLEYILIADNSMDNFTLHPAFSHGGVEKNAFYIGAYSTSESNASQSGYLPRTSVSLADCRSRANSKGSGWGLMDISVLSAIQMLFLVEYATYDSQSAVGLGYSGFSSNDTKQNTGSTDSVPNLTGIPSGTTGKVDVVYRGMEGLWGNVYDMVDGVIVDAANQKYYVCNQPASYAQTVNSSYKCLNFDTPSKDFLSQYIVRLGLHEDEGLDYVMFPSHDSRSGTSGSSSTYICDTFSSSQHTEACMRCGGRWSGNLMNGLFLCDATRIITDTHTQNGSRLLYIP